MLTDIEIAQSTPMKDIREIAGALGIDPEAPELYGRYKAKLPLSLLRDAQRPDGHGLATLRPSQPCRF